MKAQARRGWGQPEEVLPLTHEDDHGDACRETDDDGIGDVLDHRAQPREPEHHQDDAGHQRGDLQSGDAVLGGNDGQHRDKCPRGPGNLNAGTAEYRGQQRRDDCRIQPLFGAGAGRDGECHGERQGDDAHHYSGKYVVANVRSRPQPGCLGLEEGDHGGNCRYGGITGFSGEGSTRSYTSFGISITRTLPRTCPGYIKGVMSTRCR